MSYNFYYNDHNFFSSSILIRVLISFFLSPVVSHKKALIYEQSFFYVSVTSECRKRTLVFLRLKKDLSRYIALSGPSP